MSDDLLNFAELVVMVTIILAVLMIGAYALEKFNG